MSLNALEIAFYAAAECILDPTPLRVEEVIFSYTEAPADSGKYNKAHREQIGCFSRSFIQLILTEKVLSLELLQDILYLKYHSLMYETVEREQKDYWDYCYKDLDGYLAAQEVTEDDKIEIEDGVYTKPSNLLLENEKELTSFQKMEIERFERFRNNKNMKEFTTKATQDVVAQRYEASLFILDNLQPVDDGEEFTLLLDAARRVEILRCKTSLPEIKPTHKPQALL